MGPYSPMLNPVEALWSKMKATVKRNMRVPQLTPPQVGAQRLQYVERLIDDAMETVTHRDVVNACQHANGLFPAALALQDMPVGR